MTLRLLLLLCIWQTIFRPVAASLPENPLIRLRIYTDDTMQRYGGVTDCWCKDMIQPQLEIMNKHLRDGLGIQVQHLEWKHHGIQPSNGQRLDQYYGLAAMHVVLTDSFAVFLTKDNNRAPDRVYTKNPGSGCAHHSPVIVAIQDNGNSLARDLIRAVLKQMGVTGQCCSDCILNPQSNSFEFPDCVKSAVASAAGSNGNLNCLAGERQNDQSKITICGNGIMELGEECDCLPNDSGCQKCCSDRCRRTDCKSGGDVPPPVAQPQPSAPVVPPAKTPDSRPPPKQPNPPAKPPVATPPKTGDDSGSGKGDNSGTNSPSNSSVTIDPAEIQAGKDDSWFRRMKWPIIGCVAVLAVVLLIIAVVIVVKMRQKKGKKDGVSQVSTSGIPSSSTYFDSSAPSSAPSAVPSYAASGRSVPPQSKSRISSASKRKQKPPKSSVVGKSNNSAVKPGGMTDFFG